MRAAHGQLEQHGIEPDERRRGLTRPPHPGRGARDQCHGCEAREHGDRLQRPHPCAQPERDEQIGPEREQRAVGGVLEGPADEREHGVDRRFGGDVRVRVKPMQDAEPREGQIAEHVLGEQRRPEQQRQVGERDRRGDRLAGQLADRHQHRGVAGAHRKRPGLEAARADARREPAQRSGQPAGPAAAARGHERPRGGGRAGGEQQRRRDDRRQPARPERAHPRAARAPIGGARLRALALTPVAGGPDR